MAELAAPPPALRGSPLLMRPLLRRALQLLALLAVCGVDVALAGGQLSVEASRDNAIDTRGGMEVAVAVDAVDAEVLQSARKRSKRSEKSEPQVASLLADFDHDGRVGRSEIQQIKDNLHHFFDMDDSGGIDSKEIKTILSNDKDVDSAFAKLDRDQDAIISHQELDERWEAVGAEMTVDEVADWVTFSVQLPQYAELFRRHSISGYTFPLLMDNDGSRLEEIGVRSSLHRRQLAMFLKMKYLGMGRKPDKVVSTVCETEIMPVELSVDAASKASANILLHVAWVPADNGPQQFQLQRRSPGESAWSLVYSGPDTEFIDVIASDRQHLHVVYRLATWNSYGHSPHAFVRCEVSPASVTDGSSEARRTLSRTTSLSSVGSSDEPMDADVAASGDISLVGLFKTYLWWLDEAIALALFIALPIRGFIYGDADYVLRFMRRLPPNAPTRVIVDADPSKATLEFAAATVSWEKPVDNGVPIVCYTVRWTRMKTDEIKWVKLLTVPLPTAVTIDKLHHGETYKFTVESTNAFGLVTRSSRSTYMVPLPELKGKLMPRRTVREPKVVAHVCHICHDPKLRKKAPFTSKLDRKILHFCCLCDREFCHYHKGEVFHTKALSCPAVDGRCICATCKESRLQRAETY